jgi:hypothetical protein
MFITKKTMFLVIMALTTLASVCALGDLAENQDTLKKLKMPRFFALEEGQDSLTGLVIDGPTSTKLKDISLFGRTEIGGICREDNDSVTSINLEHVAELVVIDKDYKSVHHAPQGKAENFCLVKKIARDGTATEGLLMPRKIIVSGIEQPSGDQKAWFLAHINSLKIPSTGPHDQLASNPITTEASAGEGHNKKVVAQTVTPYAEKTVKVVENVGSGGIQKTFTQALSDVLSAIISLVKVLFGFLRNLFW